MRVDINTNLPQVKRPVKINYNNYLNYLSVCWANHYGAVISPDILWHIVLCEIAAEVARNPERYRDLFSDSKEKQEISVLSDSLTELPLNSVIDALRGKTKISPDLFLPKFSTTGNMESFAFSAAFCDLVSPYYSYSMYLCGIPYIKVFGTPEDYRLASKHVDDIIASFGLGSPVSNWLVNVSSGLLYIANSFKNESNDELVKFYSDFFDLKRCGSGSQVEVSGWVESFFLKKPSVKFVDNYNTCVSTVKYKNLSTDKDYEMTVALSGGVFKDDLLVPSFVKRIREINENSPS